MTAEERRVAFEVIVLESLWLIIRLLAYSRRQQGGPGSGYSFNAPHVRGNMVSYMDQVGLQTDGAKDYRRTRTFPEIGQEP